LIAVLCDKAGQMPASSVNFLWLASDSGLTEPELAAAVASLRARAEHKDEEFFTRRGYASAAAFLKQYQQLSGVVLWQGDATAIWLNPLARHKPGPELVTALRRLAMN
jgi:hypothetical protein